MVLLKACIIFRGTGLNQHLARLRTARADVVGGAWGGAVVGGAPISLQPTSTSQSGGGGGDGGVWALSTVRSGDAC